MKTKNIKVELRDGEMGAYLAIPEKTPAGAIKRAPHPEVEIHFAAAEERGIAAGDWVSVETPFGSMRARARLNDQLDPRVVVGEHGWWQGCDEVAAPCYDPFSPEGANFNATVDPTVRDPISGTPAHRANLCQITRIAAS